MYTNFNNEVVSNLESSTKYTEYLKTLSSRSVRGGKTYHEDGGGNRRQSQRNNFQGSTPLLAISDNEVKFSNIFSPNESNALKLHLLQKTSSLPLLDHSDSNTADGAGGSSSGAFGDNHGSVVGDHDDLDPSLLNRRRSTAIGLLHENRNSSNANSRARKGDPVANILYSTIRHGAAANNNNSNIDYDNPSADETLHTGSDSKVDYDPHEPLATVDQIALRHELLNNIRAISRATYFEDLYTGKVRRNSGSPEAEILRLLENPEAGRGPTEEHPGERTIPSKEASLSRVDRWVKETSETSSRSAHHKNDSDEDRHASLYHASVWNEKKDAKLKREVKNEDSGGGVSDATTESDVETASAYIKRTSVQPKYQHQVSKSVKSNPVTKYDSGSNKHFSKNTDRTVVSRSMGKPIIPPGIIESSASYLQTKYLGHNNSIMYNKNPQLLAVENQHETRRPFSFENSSADDLAPLSVSLPNVAHSVSNSYRSTPLPLHASSLKKHSVSRPENLNNSMAHLSTGTTNRNVNNKKRLDKRTMNAASNEQVNRRIMAQTKSLQPAPKARAVARGTRPSDRAVPGLYSRLNMNQWVMKKVCFYVNGDELHPRFEYRFRQGKDIRDLDQLLDLLTKRFSALPTGARYIFTMDGYLISSLDELINENSYVVSSIRKFKAIKYGDGSRGGGNLDSDGLPELRGNKRPRGVQKKHQVLSRKLSASDGNLHRSKRDTQLPLTQSLYTQKSVSSLNSKSVSDVPKVVAHVIEEASTAAAAALINHSPLMPREPIRVINGARPSLQSQVLLNTKTSQPFEDLVRDLALSVKLPKQPIGNCLKTLAGRQIRSYSQLRSELKAGQRAFFIYSDNITKPVVANNFSEKPRPFNTHGKPIVKAALGKVNSNSSSDLSAATYEIRDKDTKKRKALRRRRSHSPTPSQTNIQHTNPHSPSPYDWNDG